MTLEYKESQMFTQWWLWSLLLSLGILPLYGIYKQFIIGDPWGSSPLPNWGLLLFAGLVWALIYLFARIRLKTFINAEIIKIDYSPLAKKTWYWSDISKAEIVDYGFVGGWGLRYSSKGTVYNVSGRMGLLIVTKDGKKEIIGTQKENELYAFLNEINMLDME